MSSSTPARLFRLVCGGEIERSLRGILAVTLISTIAFAALWSYVGIWGITHLHASQTAVGLMYVLDAIGAALSAYFGGRLSDRLGRRLVIAAAWGTEALMALALAAVGQRIVLGFALVILAGTASGPGFAATNAIVADLVPEERRESAYAAMRVATNLGFVTGPPIGGLLLIGTHWPRFFVVVALVGLTSAAVALAALPRVHPATEATGAADTPAPGAFRAIRGDRAFLLLLGSTLLGFVVYVAYEAVLPIAAVSSFGLSPATWGLLVIINPVLVTVLQLRLTRTTERFPAAPRLALSMLLMGLPFLLLLANTSIAIIALVILIFVFGEMLWTPLSQALAARLSPATFRGAYMGAFGASSSVAWAIAPLAALYLRQSHGDTATWLFFAIAAIAGAAAGIGACRAAARRQQQTAMAPETATTVPLATNESPFLEPAKR